MYMFFNLNLWMYMLLWCFERVFLGNLKKVIFYKIKYVNKNDLLKVVFIDLFIVLDEVWMLYISINFMNIIVRNLSFFF